MFDRDIEQNNRETSLKQSQHRLMPFPEHTWNMWQLPRFLCHLPVRPPILPEKAGSVGCGERSEPHQSRKCLERCGSRWSPHPTLAIAGVTGSADGLFTSRKN